MVTIQLQRQGVGHTLRTSFLPCPHGNGWYVEITDYQSRAWLINVHYPNCAECYGTSRGQTAFSNRGTFLQLTDREEAKRIAERVISKLVGQPCQFSPFVEAYMYYSDHDYKLYPYLQTDKFVTCASYEPQTDTIRHETINVCLIAFDGPSAARFDVDPAAAKYSEQVQKAYGHFLMDVNQRQGERNAKRWLAWLLGEYIKDRGDENPVVLDRIGTSFHRIARGCHRSGGLMRRASGSRRGPT